MTRRVTPAEVRALMRRTVVWDNHGCMPLRSEGDIFLPQLSRYRRSGVNVVGLNAGFDDVPWQQTLAVLARFRHWIRRHGRTVALAGTVQELARARRDGKLAVFFDIEGGRALNNQISMIELYRDLGVRWMSLVYNRNNEIGGGCLDVDRGLTRFGRCVVEEMGRVGITVCCSHTGYRTTMDVMRRTSRPVIFSHANPLGVWRHKRNIRDAAIRACAATGGVVGINGIGMFLGANDNRPETVVTHIDYVAQLVGPEHVGIGLDYCFDSEEVNAYVRANPKMYPKDDFSSGIRMVAPEALGSIAAGLVRCGYPRSAIGKILGGNFLRVARANWPRQQAAS